MMVGCSDNHSEDYNVPLIIDISGGAGKRLTVGSVHPGGNYMGWIIGVAVLILLCIFVFMVLIIRGADAKKKGDYFRQVDDTEQEKALSKVLEDKKTKE